MIICCCYRLFSVLLDTYLSSKVLFHDKVIPDRQKQMFSIAFSLIQSRHCCHNIMMPIWDIWKPPKTENFNFSSFLLYLLIRSSQRCRMLINLVMLDPLILQLPFFHFQLNIKGNMGLNWFYFTVQHDWSRKLAPPSRSIRFMTKINHDLITLGFPPLKEFPLF